MQILVSKVVISTKQNRVLYAVTASLTEPERWAEAVALAGDEVLVEAARAGILESVTISGAQGNHKLTLTGRCKWGKKLASLFEKEGEVVESAELRFGADARAKEWIGQDLELEPAQAVLAFGGKG